MARGRGGGGGGGRGRRNRGRGGGGGASGGRQGDSFRYDKQHIEKTNKRFESYYNDLLGHDEEESMHFWDALRRDLPNSFRFTGSRGHALAVQDRLVKHYIPEITNIDWEGKKVDPPQQVPWFPDRLAWQMTTPKSVVRRFPPFKAFQQFLVSETSTGNISRQEIVSMIPPLLLDVQPSHTVLDLCAAPGSKSAQLIEAVHAGEEARLRRAAKAVRRTEGREVSPDGDGTELELSDATLMQDDSDDGRATGLLIANDVDYKRAHMLIHQMKRLNSPNLIVMNHDATMFPSLKLPSPPAEPGAPRAPGRYLKFDRILADVPCSGDGTVRKNANVWKDWTPGNALGLHTVQVKILVRALQMLKVGGRMVYSTCSMNPVENEAVVAAAIERCGGLSKVGILEAASKLPGLEHKKGFLQWKVMDKTGRLWSSFEEVEAHLGQHGVDGLSRLSDTMFAPKEEMPLDRCLRIEPHQQDTGGFFITILEKKSEIKARTDGGRTATQIQAEAEAKDMTTNPDQAMPSIMEIANEIEHAVPNANGSLNHLESLDALAPPPAEAEAGTEVGDVSSAARQNTEPEDLETQLGSAGGVKRVAEESPYGDLGIKRAKVEKPGGIIDEVEADGRLEHWPPPPASRPDVKLAHASAETAQLAHGEASAESGFRAKKNSQPFEEPYKYLKPEHEDLLDIYDFYGLSPRFPRDRFMVRNATGEPARTIYYTSTLARDILTENEGKGMKFVHSGVKMFVKQDVQREDQCAWRIQTDGLQLVESWIKEDRIVRLHSRKTLHALLKEMFPKVDGGGWKNLGEIGVRVRDIVPGCCVLRVETGEGEDSFAERMVLPLWRSLHSVNLMLPKEDRRAMLLRLYNDNGELIDHQKQRAALAQASKASNRGSRPSAENNDPPPPGEALLANQRAADLEEVAQAFGEASDDDEDHVETGQQGGVKADLDRGVVLKADEAEEKAKLQLRQEEVDGVREGGPGAEDKEDTRETITGEPHDGTLFMDTTA